jgi:hypothetical protein
MNRREIPISLTEYLRTDNCRLLGSTKPIDETPTTTNVDLTREERDLVVHLLRSAHQDNTNHLCDDYSQAELETNEDARKSYDIVSAQDDMILAILHKLGME